MALDLYVEHHPILRSPIPIEAWQGWMSAWIVKMDMAAENWELTLRLTDNEEIRQLNAQYRGKDAPTDVLSFAAAETPMPFLQSDEPVYLGDIVISLPIAAAQAETQGHSLARELVWLASHGFLHLLGWDHPDEERLSQMWMQQETLLQEIGQR